MQRSLFFSTLGLCAAGAVLAGNLGAQNLRPAQQVSTAGAFDAAIGSSGDLSCAVWVEGQTVYASTSDGRGKTWSAPVQVSTDTVGRKDMRGDDVVVVDGVIYVAWVDRRNDTDLPSAGADAEREFAFTRSTDGGATWATETLVTGGLGIILIRGWKFLGTAGATNAQNDDLLWFVVSAEVGAGDEELYVFYSSDGGASWTRNFAQPGTTEGGNANDVDGMSATAEGNTLHLAWNDERSGASPIADDTWYNSTTDGGATWQHASCLNVEADAVSDAEATAIAVNGSTVAIAWTQQRFNSGSTEEVLCAISTDSGATFAASQVVGGYTRESSAGAGDGDDVDGISIVVADNGDVIVAFADDRNTSANEVFAAVSVGGGAFTEVGPLGTGANPTAAHGIYNAIVWTDNSSPDSLLSAISYDDGASWDVVTQAPSGAGDIDLPWESGDTLAPNYPVVVNDYYHANVMFAWLDDSLGGNELFVGGFRAPTTTAIGWDDPLNNGAPMLQFQFKGFQDKVVGAILLSFGTGPTTLDGRTVDMDPGFLGTYPAGSTILLAPLTNGAGAAVSIPNVWPTLFPGYLLGVPTLLNYTGFGYGSPSASITSDTATMIW